MEMNESVWGKFLAAVQKMYTGPAGSQLQVLADPIPFDWGTKTGNKTPLEYWNFCNQLPVWSEVGSYAPMGGSLVDSYKGFLDKIKQDYSQDLKNQITTAQEKLAADVSQIDSFNTTTGTAYKKYADNQTLLNMPVESVADWLKSTGRDSQLESLKAQVQKDNDVIASLLAQENRQYADAWAQFNDTKFQTPYSDASNNVVMKRIYEWSENPTDITQKLRAGTLANAKTMTFGYTTENYDYSKSWAGGRASINYFFWGVEGGGAWTQMNEQKSYEGFKAEISFKNISLVNVNPETGWFDSGYLKTQADGPFVDKNTVGFANEATGNQTYFFGGVKAILPAQVTGFLLGYQPSFKLTVSASAFSDVYKSVEAGGGIRIGPFRFGGSGGHTSRITKSSSESNTIEGSDTSDVAQIFAVFIKTLP